ncbi:hypothetical protein [Neorhizobium alkalisoli]|uniref:hypothetical protein n=1 Tax=Neorhizobium alkalisoli TaxID=528178 RepID=UPI000CF9D73C|nr:hypothetical protein [Neorhizobium alkalisoli]
MFTRVSIYIFLWAINSFAVGDVDTVLLTLPTFLLCIFNVYRIKNRYLTAADMFWFVYFIFFVIGPIQTLSDNYFRKGGPVFGIYFTDGEIYTAAAVTFLFALSATVAGLWMARDAKPSRPNVANYVIDSGMLVPLFGVVLLSFVAFVVFSGGIGNVLASRSERDADSVSLLRIFALASLLISTFFITAVVMRGRQNGRSPGFSGFAILGCSLALLLVAQNPFNTPRYFLIQSWMPVMLLLLKGRLGAMPFYFACLFGMLVVLPITSLTSRFGTSIFEAIGNIDVKEDFFRLPYVDIFDLLLYEMKFIGDMGFSYGNRVLGALLFFVPRSIWTGKSQLLALQMGDELVAMKVAGTENLSLFFGGEFYADFGLVGVVVFGLLFSALYLRFLHNRKLLLNGFSIREFIIISATPIIVRGPIGANAPLIFLTLIFLAIYLRLLARPSRAMRPFAALAEGKR